MAFAMAITGWQAGAASADTTIVVGSATVLPGQSFSIPISITGVADSKGLGAYDLTLTYNASVITITGCSSGTNAQFAEPAACNASTAGTVRINDFISQLTGPTGDFVLCQVNARAIGSAGQPTSLSINLINLGNANGDEIEPRNTTDGTVTVAAPARRPRCP